MKTIQIQQTQQHEQQVGKLKWKQELWENVRTKQDNWIKNRLAEGKKPGVGSRIKGGESKIQGGGSRIQDGESRIKSIESRIQGDESRIQGGEDVSKIPNGKSRIEVGYIHMKHWYEETSKSCGNYTHATGKLCGWEVGNLLGGEGETSNRYSHGISVGVQPSCGTDMTTRAPPTRTRTRIYRDKSKERTLLSSKNTFNSSFKRRNEENKTTRLGIAIADNFPSPYDKVRVFYLIIPKDFCRKFANPHIFASQ